MLGKLDLMRRDPRRYVPIAVRFAVTFPLRCLSRLMVRAPFFLQEQMDLQRVSTWHDRRFCETTGGFRLPKDPVDRRICTPQPWDGVRRDMLVLLMRSIVERGIPGDFAELGVYRGDSARLIHHYAPDRMLHLFDTFEGFAAQDVDADAAVTGLRDVAGHFSDTSLARVLRRVRPQSDCVRLHPGHFPGTFTDALASRKFAFVHVDVDLYDPVRAGLEAFYPHLSPGGFIVVHDYNAWPGPRRAVDAFADAQGLVPVPMPDKNGSVLLIKPEP